MKLPQVSTGPGKFDGNSKNMCEAMGESLMINKMFPIYILLINFFLNVITDNNKVSSILKLFEKKKEELDAKCNAENELQKKLAELKIDKQFDEFFDEMGWTNNLVRNKVKKKLFHFDQLDRNSGKLKTSLGSVNVEKEMEGSVLKPGIEKDHRLPRYDMSEKKLKAIRKVSV